MRPCSLARKFPYGSPAIQGILCNNRRLQNIFEVKKGTTGAQAGQELGRRKKSALKVTGAKPCFEITILWPRRKKKGDVHPADLPPRSLAQSHATLAEG